ncbi:DNA polymerase III subunit beta [Roseibium sediminicola]|uniref:Beta sliding clamp n=1 Tax=Roseibium sediminicola TaxID=2933272 RepID=A0ABT0GRC9_9HYPH|nr:hypothetical protein [Roseibium sp. CAU 1639]MCK7611984.1 hypothetical protein [Roseibium sp. CAU 1639]
MLIETTAGDLRLALDTVQAAVPRRSTIPILCAVLLQDGAVRGTCLDMEISVRFAAKRFDGAAVIPFRQLHELVKSLPADLDLRIQSKGDDYGVHLFFRGGRYKLPSFPATDFPTWTGNGDLAEMAKPDGFRAALDACTGFISTEETRYHLNGVCFSKDPDGKSVLVATDGHRLIAYDFAHECEINLILPRATVLALLGMVEPEEVLFSDSNMEFRFPGGSYLRTKLIDGTFPDWTRVVPAYPEDTRRISFAPLEMKKALDRMRRLTGQRNRGLSISASANGDLLVVTMNGMDGEECAERIESGSAEHWQGAQAFYGFNSSYLSELCQLHRQAERISIVAPDAGSPAKVGPDETKATTVLMPMRVDEGTLVRTALLTFAGGANDQDAKEAAA